jgi:hypothetical protein
MEEMNCTRAHCCSEWCAQAMRIRHRHRAGSITEHYVLGRVPSDECRGYCLKEAAHLSCCHNAPAVPCIAPVPMRQ